jgi:hypothetical protein
MSSLFKPVAAFTLAASILGIGPFSGPVDPHWGDVRAELAAARPREKLAEQVRTVFRPGTPRPDADDAAR